jgi:hypothetical protein
MNRVARSVSAAVRGLLLLCWAAIGPPPKGMSRRWASHMEAAAITGTPQSAASHARRCKFQNISLECVWCSGAGTRIARPLDRSTGVARSSFGRFGSGCRQVGFRRPEDSSSR